MPIGVEEARKRLKQAAETDSARGLARRMGIPGKYKQVSSFLNGEIAKPRAIMPQLLKLAEELGPALESTRTDSKAPGDDEASERMGPLALSSAVGRAYWRGRLDSDIRTLSVVETSLGGVTETLQALRGLLGEATQGVASLVATGALGPGQQRLDIDPGEGAVAFAEMLARGLATQAQRNAKAPRDESSGAPK